MGGTVHEDGAALDELRYHHLDGAIIKLSLAGGTPVTLASQQHGVTEAIAVSATSVFWTGNNGGIDAHTLRKVPISGGDAAELVTSPSNGADRRRW